MEMVELYKVLADSTKIIVVKDRFKWKYLYERPLYMGEIYDIPVKIINSRINFMKIETINEIQYIFCEVD